VKAWIKGLPFRSKSATPMIPPKHSKLKIKPTEIRELIFNEEVSRSLIKPKTKSVVNKAVTNKPIEKTTLEKLENSPELVVIPPKLLTQ
jgi:hypothetical protein